MGLVSFLILSLIAVLIIALVCLVIKIFIDDWKHISKKEAKFFEKGQSMTETEILDRINELKKEEKEYEKKFGRFSRSYEILGEISGLKKALRAL